MGLIGKNVKVVEDYGQPSIKLWFHRIDQGIKRRREEAKTWTQNENFEQGKHWLSSNSGKLDFGIEDDVTINKISSWVSARLSEIAFRNPRAKFTPASPSGYEQVPVPVLDPEQGPVYKRDPQTGGPVIDPLTRQPEPEVRLVSRHKVCEALCNHIAGHPITGLSATGRRFVKAGLLAYGCLKVGYKPLLQPWALQRRTEPETDAETGFPKWDLYEIDENGELLRDKEGYLIPTDGGIVADQWFIDWVPHRQMIIDPEGSNDFRRHGWVAYEYLAPLKRVKKDPRFKNTADLKSTGTSYRFDPDNDNEDHPWENMSDNLDPYVKDETDVVRLFEVWDFEKQRIMVLADGHGEYLLDETIPEGIEHSPFVFFRPNERLDDFYPRPPASDLVPINSEYNKHRKLLMSKARKDTNKFLYVAGAIDDSEKAKLESPVDGVFAAVDLTRKGVNTLQEVVMPLPQPGISGDAFAYGRNIALDFDEVSAQPGEGRGVASAKTATQVENMQMHPSLRVDDQRNQLANAYREMFKKLWDSIQANMTQEQAIMVMGPDGSVFQTVVEREDILGDYDIETDIEEMIPQNRAMQQAQLNGLLQTIATAPFLVLNPKSSGALFEIYGVKDQRLIDGIVEGAERQVAMQEMAAQAQMQAAQARQGGSPESEADNFRQRAAGRQ